MLYETRNRIRILQQSSCHEIIFYKFLTLETPVIGIAWKYWPDNDEIYFSIRWIQYYLLCAY